MSWHAMPTKAPVKLGRPGVVASSEHLEGSDTSKVLATFADGLPAALVIMATHGRSGMSRISLGSVAMRTVHHATHPVLVVRPPAEAFDPKADPRRELASLHAVLMEKSGIDPARLTDCYVCHR